MKAVGENRPWDKIFRELMLPDQTDKARKAAAEYLRQRVKDPDRLTAEVSSTFFGVNISCAQCHDHPLVHDWKQDHFYGMKAFLDRTFINGNGNEGFLGEHDYGTVKFKTTEGVERQARMMFLTGRKVDEPDAKEPSKEEQKKEKEQLQRPKKDKVPRRRRSSAPGPSWSSWRLQPGEREFFSRAIVNRIWHRLFGRGLVMPLDQMHSANPPSHPELLAWLARDTVDHGYDLRRLDPRPGPEPRLCPRAAGGKAASRPVPSLFAVALVRPLTPMQLASSLRMATADPASLPGRRQARGSSRSGSSPWKTVARSLAASFGSSGGDTQIGVAEALLFSNGKHIAQEFLSDGDGRLRRSPEADRRAGRRRSTWPSATCSPARPTKKTDASWARYLAARTDRPEDACRQLVWALLTCAEFRFNH